MSDLVDPTRIEGIVGAKRHPTEHWGRAVPASVDPSGTATVYVLHSGRCISTASDLRKCPYSLALDQGIEEPEVWPLWRYNEDRPVRLAIVDGYLVPDSDEGSGTT